MSYSDQCAEKVLLFCTAYVSCQEIAVQTEKLKLSLVLSVCFHNHSLLFVMLYYEVSSYTLYVDVFHVVLCAFCL